jgi:diguanylate cyclase (GGDEF)-like protein
MMEQVRQTAVTTREGIPDRKLRRYFAGGFLVIFLLSCAAIFAIEYQVTSFARKEIQTNEQRVVRLENQLLSRDISLILGDLQYLQHTYEEILADPAQRPEIVRRWTEFSQHRGIYDQIRYIDSQGDEIIRINFDGEQARAVEASGLQNKRDRYYFTETEKLPAGVIYASPMDLNMENGVVEQPLKPVIRFAVPLFQSEYDFSGILILNHLTGSVLSDFKELAETGNGFVSLLNYDGHWLSCGNPGNEWNFMYEDRKERTFGAVYPDEWELIRKGEGQVITENGMFTYMPVSLDHLFLHGASGAKDVRIAAADRKWFIVSVVPSDSEYAYAFSQDPLVIAKDILVKNRYQFLWLALLSGLVGFIVFLNRRQYYKVKYFSEHDPLTGLLNRRAGYEALKEMLRESEKGKGPVSVCFIDINGLKQVNDILGHDLGDELILAVSDIMARTVRKADLAIRLGGDEFMVVFGDTAATEAEEIWTRIVAKFEEINRAEDRPYLISASHGIVERKDRRISEMDELIRLADEKMYREKSEIKKKFAVIRERKGN